MRAATGLIAASALGLTIVALGKTWPRAGESASPADEGRVESAFTPPPATDVSVEEPERVTDSDAAPSASSPPSAPEREVWAARERELLARIDELNTRLADERAMRDLREKEWLEFTQLIQALPVAGTPDVPSFLEDENAPEDEHADPAAPSEDATEARREALAEERAARRAQELLIQLRALLIAEQVAALDFLEIGRVREGWTGPIVVRLLDDWDRPMGTLAAERLRLEVSRAGRTVTLILEEGFESHGGVAVPFGPPSTPGAKRGGVRRIDLPDIDPTPWIEAFPELIDPEAEEPIVDDGKWNLAYVRTRLNELLRSDTTSGHWRLRGLGGVTAGVLRDVHLVQLSDGGRVVRRLFADHLRLEKHAEGIRLRLDEGVQERGGRKAPFLEGRYRIYLPRAKAQDWVDANLPGLAPAPGERSAPAAEDEEAGAEE